MSWSIGDIARLLTEDPDVPASPEAMAMKAQAAKIGGGDPSSTDQVRKQMEKQKKLKQQEQDQQQKKLDPFFKDLEGAQSDMDALKDTMQQQQDAEQEALGQLGMKVPSIDKALRGIKGNLPQ